MKKLLLILSLFPALGWSWGAPPPPPHVIDLRVKSLPNDESPKVPVTKEEMRKRNHSPKDEYRYDVPADNLKELRELNEDD